MSSCCDPRAPKVYMLTVGGVQVGLTRVEQTYRDVMSLDLADEQVADKLLEIVHQKNYIPEGFELEYKVALLTGYKNFVAKFR